MAHDGQDLHMKPTLIPDLLALTAASHWNRWTSCLRPRAPRSGTW